MVMALKPEVCGFICSSDNTHDVFRLLAQSFRAAWPSPEIPLYVGLNQAQAEPGFEAVRTASSGWRLELQQQISALPDDINYIVLLLDDFHFDKPIPAALIERSVACMKHFKADYLRLRPIERSLLGGLVRRALRRVWTLNGFTVERLPTSEPYYSSLQVAVWRRGHLLSCLAAKGSIWDFEHHVPIPSMHLAVTKPVLSYRHLVEKGRWYRNAPRILGIQDAGAFAARGFEEDVGKNSALYNRAKFLVVGYTFFRIRRMLREYRRG